LASVIVKELRTNVIILISRYLHQGF